MAPAATAQSSQADGLTRRAFISWFWFGWITFTVGVSIFLGLLGRFLFPNVLFEKPSVFRAGLPSEFQRGVDERFKDSQSVWLVRSDEGIYAISTVCTHLGCTPNWLSGEGKFKCPCHGSGFRSTGLNFEGPAPRPLERFAISMNDEGVIVVDKSKSIRYPEEWSKSEFMLKI